MATRHRGTPATHRARARSVVNTRRATSGELPVASRQLVSLLSVNDLDALIERAFALLRQAVPCDFVSAVYRNAGPGLLKERDSRGREYGPAFMRRYAELTPALPLVRSSPGIRILTTRTHLPLSTKELRRTPFYREIMREQGWRHGVSLCFWGEQPTELPILVLVPYRRERRPDFSQADVRALQRLYPFLECAVNRIHDREAASTLHDGIALAGRGGACGLAFLNGSLTLVEANAVARQLCASWLDHEATARPGESPRVWRTPSDVVDACLDLREEWRALIGSNPAAGGVRRRRRLTHPLVAGLSASITMIGPGSAGLAEPTFVLELDRRGRGATIDASASPANGLFTLTPAEREVAMHLVEGLSNQEIATRLGKSIHAVKFLLHKIYENNRIPGRTALVALLRSGQR